MPVRTGQKRSGPAAVAPYCWRVKETRTIPAQRLLYGAPLPRPVKAEAPLGWIAGPSLFALSGAHFRRPVKAALYPEGNGALLFYLDSQSRSFRFAASAPNRAPSRFEIPFPQYFNERAPVFLRRSGNGTRMLFWRTLDGSMQSGLIDDGLLVETWEIAEPGRAVAPTDSKHGVPGWFELGGRDDYLHRGLYLSKRPGPGEPARTRLCSASSNADRLWSFHDPAGNHLAAWVEEEGNGICRIRSWSSLEGEREVLARGDGRIEIIDLQSRGGLPCLIWKEQGHEGTYLSDPTTAEGGLLLPEELPLSAFLAGQSCLVYFAALNEDGQASVTSLHPSGDSNDLFTKTYRGSGKTEGDLAFSEGKRGDVRLFFSEVEGDRAQIMMFRIHDLDHKGEVIYRSPPGYRTRIVEAQGGRGGPAAVLFTEFKDGGSKATLRVSFDEGP